MKNLNIDLENETLTIEVDLSKNYGNSRSGKSILIASSEGNKRILKIEYPERFIYLGIFVYETKEDYRKEYNHAKI